MCIRDSDTTAEILVPLNELAERYSTGLRYWDEDLISKIAAEYKVSKEVVLLRIKSIGYVSQSDYLKLKKKWDDEFRKNKKKRGGGNYYINKISALGRQYINCVIESYKLGTINDLQVSNFLGMKFTNLSKIEAEVYA